MASQHRSVWEVRFRALTSYIHQRKENVTYIAGSMALSGNLNSEHFKALVEEEKIISDFQSRARQLESESASEIWLDCDF